MTMHLLYRYERDDQGITVTTEEPDTSYTVLYRIIADEDKMLTLDGENLFLAVDTDNVSGWYEVDAPIYEEDIIYGF
jgi:hypothetical protein